MSAPGRTPEATTYRITPRRSAIAATAALVLATSSTADLNHQPPAQAAPPAAAAASTAPDLTAAALLTARTQLVDEPRASRHTPARRPATRAASPESKKTKTRPARATRHPAARQETAKSARAQGTARRGAAAVLEFARQQIGDPYRLGAAGPHAWDCSGLTMKAFARAGVQLPHKAARQGRLGSPVTRSHARPGDLVVWGTYHVGIYVGDGKVLHSPRPGKRVQVASLWGSPRFRRLL